MPGAERKPDQFCDSMGGPRRPGGQMDADKTAERRSCHRPPTRAHNTLTFQFGLFGRCRSLHAATQKWLSAASTQTCSRHHFSSNDRRAVAPCGRSSGMINQRARWAQNHQKPDQPEGKFSMGFSETAPMVSQFAGSRKTVPRSLDGKSRGSVGRAHQTEHSSQGRAGRRMPASRPLPPSAEPITRTSQNEVGFLTV